MMAASFLAVLASFPIFDSETPASNETELPSNAEQKQN
jgi:hypothetical protein